MSRNPVLLGGITLLLVNVLYFWLNPAAPPHDEGTAETERWYFASLPPAEKIDLQALLSSGAWGRPHTPEEEASKGEAGSAPLDEAEAVLLRQQLRGITHQSNEWRVLFEHENDLTSAGIGDQLGDSSWKILSIQADRLLLQDGEQQRSLLLYPQPEEP